MPLSSVLRESHCALLSRSDGTCLMFLTDHPGCPSEPKRERGNHFRDGAATGPGRRSTGEDVVPEVVVCLGGGGVRTFCWLDVGPRASRGQDG